MGGYSETSYQVEIDFIKQKAEYVVLDYGFELMNKETINLSYQALEEFRKNLEEIGVFSWEKHYEDSGILNGTKWSLEIVFEDQRFKYTGSNAFPEKWEEFCKAVRTVTGREYW